MTIEEAFDTCSRQLKPILQTLADKWRLIGVHLLKDRDGSVVAQLEARHSARQFSQGRLRQIFHWARDAGLLTRKNLLRAIGHCQNFTF